MTEPEKTTTSKSASASISVSIPPRTWLEWISSVPEREALARAQPLLTAAELIQELKKISVRATQRDLSFWQKQGIVPYPTREKRNGVSWAIYPYWMIEVIQVLRNLQSHGKTLYEIRQLLGSNIRNTYAVPLEGTARQSINEYIANQEYREALEGALPFLDRAVDAFKRMQGSPSLRGISIVFRPIPEDARDIPSSECLPVDIYQDESDPNTYWHLRYCSE